MFYREVDAEGHLAANTDFIFLKRRSQSGASSLMGRKMSWGASPRGQTRAQPRTSPDNIGLTGCWDHMGHGYGITLPIPSSDEKFITVIISGPLRFMMGVWREEGDRTCHFSFWVFGPREPQPHTDLI